MRQTVTPRLRTDGTVSFEHPFDFKVFDVREGHIDTFLFFVHPAVDERLVLPTFFFVAAFALVTLEAIR